MTKKPILVAASERRKVAEPNDAESRELGVYGSVGARGGDGRGSGGDGNGDDGDGGGGGIGGGGNGEEGGRGGKQAWPSDGHSN